MSIVGAPKRIQEISAEGEEPPPEFFVKKDTIFAGNLGSVSSIQIPIIDLNLLSLDSNFEAYKDKINKLLDTLSSYGVFQVIGHGMSSSYLEEIRNLIKKFFCLSIKEKQKYGRAADGYEGYGNDPIFVEGQRLEKEHWYKLDLTCTKCPKPDKILGVKAHADASIITTLLQDKEVEGLQVLKDGKWYGVPTIPHALLINVGDQLEIMSNGIFKSPIHRVAANSEQERISQQCSISQIMRKR
ncbi:hypothetical protein H5410_037672 [Solanum commersonii]|uniref:Fe2OG dioxygenase domain-containing protein n=1 Tax=Solanum commersonii TaxID=4109 RepID=A0A9J5YA62_SOLCO|nr:hypothetical protein H5410_037672 [Solanum commersonii]